MGRRLAGYVVLPDPTTAEPVVLSPEVDVPAWAVPLITNPECWASSGLDEPARAGRGSSRDAWASYASGIHVAFPEGATRDEIIAAVDAARS